MTGLLKIRASNGRLAGGVMSIQVAEWGREEVQQRTSSGLFRGSNPMKEIRRTITVRGHIHPERWKRVCKFMEFLEKERREVFVGS